MKGKSLFILFLLTVGVLAYVYYGIQKPAEQKEARADSDDTIAGGTLDKLEWIEVSVASEIFRLERQETEGWRLASPLQDLAAQSKIESLVAALQKMKKMKILFSKEEIAKNVPDRIQFGLTPPRISIKYKTSDLANPFQIAIGSSNPAATGLFFETQDIGIGVGSMELDFLANQTSKDFRELRLTTVSANDFSEFSVTAKGRSMKFKKDGTEWKMTEPFQFPVDQEEVSGLAEKIGFIRVNDFLNKTPPSLAKPEIKVVVGFGQGVKDARSNESDSRPSGLEILLSRSKNDYYAKSDKTPAGTIVPYHFENFLKSPEEFVRKSFDRFLNADVQEIQAHEIGKRPVTVTRSSSGLGEGAEKALNFVRSFKPRRFIKKSEPPSELKSGLRLQIRLKDKTEQIKKLLFVFDLGSKVPLVTVDDGDSQLQYEFAKDALDLKVFEMKESATEVPPIGAK